MSKTRKMTITTIHRDDDEDISVQIVKYQPPPQQHKGKYYIVTMSRGMLCS